VEFITNDLIITSSIRQVPIIYCTKLYTLFLVGLPEGRGVQHKASNKWSLSVVPAAILVAQLLTAVNCAMKLTVVILDTLN
jgi:hypothetical protein